MLSYELSTTLKTHNSSLIIQKMDPLHGITLEKIVTELYEKYGWEHLGYLVNINCFKNNPTIKSSLKFLRKTPWARKKVEDLYIERICK